MSRSKEHERTIAIEEALYGSKTLSLKASSVKFYEPNRGYMQAE